MPAVLAVANFANGKRGRSLSGNRNAQAFMAIVAITVWYQLICQYIMLRKLHASEDAMADCGTPSTDSSPQCLERHLFQSWRLMDMEEVDGSESSEALERLARDRDDEGLSLSSAPDSSVQDVNTEHTGTQAGSASAHVEAKPVGTPSNTLQEYAHHHQHRNHSADLQALETRMEKFDALEKSHQQWEQELSGDIVEFERDLCADPRRHGYPACAEFLAKSSAPASDVLHSAAQTVSTSTTAATDASGAGFLARPQANTPALAKTHERPSSGFLSKDARGYAERLNWKPVLEWKSSEGRDGIVSVSREQIRYSKWQGMIPKVACITAVPSGKSTSVHLKYFLDNFKLQSYEGPKQLVLVYNKADAAIEKLVKAHADGIYIKAVPYRDGATFPSTTAFRYGAWAAEAEVIARWNFDEWHHPHRLSMQVHALALTARPVSLLKRWTVLTDVGQTLLSGKPGWEGSIVGETSWMREHWMPMLGEELSLLAGVHSQRVVQVDMPELSVYSADAKQEWADILHHFGLEESQRPDKETTTTISPACSGLDDSVGATNSSVEQAGLAGRAVRNEIDTQVGQELGAAYVELASKQASIARLLRSLCDEAATARSEQRAELYAQAEKIAIAKHQMDEHFRSVASLFSGGSLE